MLLAGSFIALNTASAAIIPGKCTESDFFYEEHHYIVRSISIETINLTNPLEFLFRLKPRLQTEFAQVKAKLPLKEGSEFSDAIYSQGLNILNSEFGELDPGVRIKVAYQAPRLRNCDDLSSPRSLDVVYRIYIADYRAYNSHTFEGYLSDITRSLLPGKISQEKGKLLPQPFAGYNSSRDLFAGARGAFNATAAQMGFNKLDFDLSGSQSSADIDVGFVGERNPKAGAIKNLQWRLGYRYANIPGDEIRLKESTALGQFSAATRPRGNNGLVVRFGSSFEFGNSQTDLTSIASMGSVPQTAYGSLKTFVGLTANQGNNTWKASYGLTLGETGKGFRVDYVKHVFDATYKADFLPRPHYPFQLDAQVSAGVIQSSSGRIPVTDRFFGGNAHKEFIQGMDWQINSGPYIRSIPQNTFGLFAPSGSVGGTRFVSANLTVAQTIWKRPAVPDEVGNDPEVRIKLRGQIMSASIATKLSYLTETTQFKQLLERILSSEPPTASIENKDIASILRGIKNVLSSITAKGPNDPVPDIISELDQLIDDTLEQISEIRKSPDIGSVRTLVTGFGPAVPSSIEKIIKGSEDEDIRGLEQLVHELEIMSVADPLKKAAFATLRTQLIDLMKQLDSQSKQVATELEAVKLLGMIPEADLVPAKNRLASLQSTVEEISGLLEGIDQQLSSINPPLAPEKLAITSAAASYAEVSIGAISRARNADTDVSYAALKMLVEDTGKITPAALTGLRQSLITLSDELRSSGLSSQSNSLAPRIATLQQIQSEIKTDLAKVHIPDVELKARRDIAFTGRTLDTIFRRLNLVSFAPVVMADVAWMGPRTSPEFGGTRYGFGPGGRLSLVSVDLTVGYSINPSPRFREGRGALVFSLDIRDLFR